MRLRLTRKGICISFQPFSWNEEVQYLLWHYFEFWRLGRLISLLSAACWSSAPFGNKDLDFLWGFIWKRGCRGKFWKWRLSKPVTAVILDCAAISGNLLEFYVFLVCVDQAHSIYCEQFLLLPLLVWGVWKQWWRCGLFAGVWTRCLREMERQDFARSALHGHGVCRSHCHWWLIPGRVAHHGFRLTGQAWMGYQGKLLPR